MLIIAKDEYFPINLSFFVYSLLRLDKNYIDPSLNYILFNTKFLRLCKKMIIINLI